MRKIMILGVLAAGLAGSLAAQEKDFSLLQKYKTVESRLEKAQKCFAKDDAAGCRRELEAVLAVVRDHHEALHIQSVQEYKAGDFEAALRDIAAAKAGYIRMRETYLLFQAEKAKRTQDEGVAGGGEGGDTDSSQLHLARGQNRCQIGEFLITTKYDDDRDTTRAKALRSEEEAKPVPGEYDFFQGNCLFKLGRGAEAEARYRAALRTDPQHSGAANNLANLLYAGGKPREALTVITQAESAGVVINAGLKKAVEKACAR
jgi:tetratricopeptide (TPR) repeat protein